MRNSYFWTIALLLSLYLCIFSFQKINFLTADIGRHIKNGEIFLNSNAFGIPKSDVLHTNLFSYTYQKFPFINHHWGSGIAMYLIFLASGFSGLSIAYWFCIILAFIFALLVAKDEANLFDIFITGLFLTPLVADRTEIRPESISYLLISVFIYILFQFSKNRIPWKWLLLIPLLEALWSNMHIYFIFGPFLVGVFLFETLVKRNFFMAKKLGIILALTFFATLITPYGLSGAVYPFTIFQNYGYRIVENQSIPFLENLSFINPSFLWYKVTLGLIVLSSALTLIRKRKDFPISLTIISLTFAVLAYFGIRHMTAFALVSLPLLAINFSVIQKSLSKWLNREITWFLYGIISFLILVSTFTHFSNKLPWNRNFGLGVVNGSFDSINFIKNNDIHGPFFNNYDIGGAMIFSFFPQKKVFVDNRPETYPAEFFNNVYIPTQESNVAWQKTDMQYHFNAIYFYRLDMTPWAQNFLLQKIDDKAWAPVYVDDQSIIFLKRNEENKKIIENLELPRSMFGS